MDGVDEFAKVKWRGNRLPKSTKVAVVPYPAFEAMKRPFEECPSFLKKQTRTPETSATFCKWASGLANHCQN